MAHNQFQLELERYYNYGSDHFVRHTHRLRINQIRKILLGAAQQHGRSGIPKALDAGSSYGVYSIILAGAGCDVTAIDLNREEIERGQNWACEKGLEGKITFRIGDIQNLDYPESSFDLIVCSEVLEHLDNPVLGAKELFRVLKANGTAVISMPNIACLFGLMQWAYRASGLRSLAGKPPLDLHQIQHSRYWFGNILALLMKAGFHVCNSYSTSHIPFLWKADALLKKFSMPDFTLGSLEAPAAKLPVLRYLGLSFIVVVTKQGGHIKAASR